MALKVWLPLNGSLENKGISNVTVTNNGATVDNNGKIGKCYSPATCTITNIGDIVNDNITYSFWAKTSSTSSWQLVIGIDNESLNQIHGIYVADSARFKYEYNPSLNIYGAEIGQWHHYCFIIRHKKSECYYDGVLSSTSDENVTSEKIGRIRLGVGSAISLNDVRIYDHCLSPLEVKEISQGLILHYKLNDNIQMLNNCYSYPTFNTSSGNGGWSHWGISGHAGSQGQNTDKTYIYNKENTYSHWVSNGETATGEYLVYQSPAFDGGYRSLQAIIKEENSKPIDETICFPDWNARNGGTPIGLWTSITSLGNGFYLCKCEGISQDGSNDLVGIYVKPGYKIYISEAYLENNKQLCSEILYPRNYIIDSSGYGNDGTVVGTLTVSEDTERYNKSTSFAASSAINCGRGAMVTDSITVNLWAKYSSYSNLMSCTEGGGWNFENNSGLTFPVYIAGIGYIHIDATQRPAVANYANNWHMFTGIYDRLNQLTKLYIDGELIGTGTVSSPNLIQYNGANVIWINAEATGSNTSGSYGNAKFISDVRIYATALSAEDILDLYHTPANIDNLGGIHGFEFIEKTPNLLNPDLREWSKESNVTCVWNEETKYFDINTNRDTSNTSRWGIFQNITVKPNTSYLFAVDMMGTGSAMGISAQDTTATWPSDRNIAGNTKRYYYILTTTATNTVGRVYLNTKPSTNQIAHFKNIYLGEIGEIASIKQNGIFENEDMVEYNENGRITKSGELAGSNFIEK